MLEIFSIVMFSIVGLWLIVASLFDFKTREVPDYLNFSLLFTGIFARLIYFLITLNYSILLEGLFGFIFTLIIGIIMSYSKQWGDGDSKIMVGIGTCLGLNFNFAFLDFNNWPILIYFFLNSLIMGAFYGLAWTISLAFLHYKDFLKEVRKINKKVYFIPLVIFLILSWYSLTYTGIYRILFLILIIGVLVCFYLLILVKVVENACMYKRQEVSKLTPGDWVIETISVKGKVICSKKDRCLDQDQIKLLKKYKIKTVLIKEGIPFVPAFLLGFLFSLIFGNILRFMF